MMPGRTGYAVSVWNFGEDGTTLPQLVRGFADMGYDGMSFLPHQITTLDRSGVAELRRVLDERGLFATVHGSSNDSRDMVACVLDALEARIVNLTFDATMTSTSVGTFYDIERMAALLCDVEELSRGTELAFGVEDFPLDARALDHYRERLAPLLTCPRFGMLLDIGHLNLRRTQNAYFSTQSESEYIANAPLRIIEAHVHDNDGTRDSHGHFGFGNIDFAAVACGLVRAGFDGVSTIEICPAFHQSTPAVSKPYTKKNLDQWRDLMEGSARDR
ncbi:MAG: sugar phosphate isomerase/epimerase [Lentisphaerae bacterium]|jgi:sugar phosphate isomerase/epimerase|nr:sugar phosphate isomerase/epimerase [Lentisphaerota bacterium]MBT4823026.1 sugar phosphate isomerase/epimerase [Lentisphaerota bacterium]MBT5610588.1 sugar phosphate isomerase/epimerase [Lentisphaerota bacterium]MBT7055595.1 sugar phosphate isomerase/epimerase [Lentisphaerota bacterium]MBT7842623.1 sugar phosphate isomerase/epimerase [Lentisphaerota bacterium]